MSGDTTDRIYSAKDCVSFRKTSESFGGLSNMAPGYKIRLQDIEVLTSEALYQICRFPNNPEIQQEIINQRSPMYAKEISKKYIHLTRADWEMDRIRIMRWALRMKLINNWYTFGYLLKLTDTKIIVEHSAKDTFWGARLVDDCYEGTNALGRLLMELRKQYVSIEHKTVIALPPPQIKNFRILDCEVASVTLNVETQLEGINERLW